MSAVACAREVGVNGVGTASASFDAFIADAPVPFRRAFVSRYGLDLGVEACSESITWAYANRARLMGMTNPVGYLYPVRQTAVRTQVRWMRAPLFPVEVGDPTRRFPTTDGTLR